MLRISVRREELKLAREELQFAEDAAKRLSTAMDFKGEDDLRRFTDNPVSQLKILLSFYRRVRGLVVLEDSDKITFDDE